MISIILSELWILESENTSAYIANICNFIPHLCDFIPKVQNVYFQITMRTTLYNTIHEIYFIKTCVHMPSLLQSTDFYEKDWTSDIELEFFQSARHGFRALSCSGGDDSDQVGQNHWKLSPSPNLYNQVQRKPPGLTDLFLHLFWRYIFRRVMVKLMRSTSYLQELK